MSVTFNFKNVHVPVNFEIKKGLLLLRVGLPGHHGNGHVHKIRRKKSQTKLFIVFLAFTVINLRDRVFCAGVK